MCACRAYLPFLASLYMFICILNSPLPPKDPMSSEHVAQVTRMISLVPHRKTCQYLVKSCRNFMKFHHHKTAFAGENPSSIFPSNFPIQLSHPTFQSFSMGFSRLVFPRFFPSQREKLPWIFSHGFQIGAPHRFDVHCRRWKRRTSAAIVWRRK